jgi:uncharacterized paraquat-inducible protein A
MMNQNVVPCPTCGWGVAVDARCCPRCGGQVTVAKLVVAHRPGMALAILVACLLPIAYFVYLFTTYN